MSDSNVPEEAERAARPAARGRRSSDRRAAIIEALKRCMIEKGYAETTLTDLANATDMSVSHLLYYYPSKEAALLDLSDELHARILADVTRHRGEPPEERIHVLVDNLFIRGALTRDELGIVLELVALGTHRPELRARLSGFGAEMTAYLEDLFAATPRHPGLSAKDAAAIVGALWMGLQNNIQFLEDLNESTARRIFRKTLLSLANLDASPMVERWAPGGASRANSPKLSTGRSRRKAASTSDA
jgi:AcrR family transcriptional regulator